MSPGTSSPPYRGLIPIFGTVLALKEVTAILAWLPVARMTSAKCFVYFVY